MFQYKMRIGLAGVFLGMSSLFLCSCSLRKEVAELPVLPEENVLAEDKVPERGEMVRLEAIQVDLEEIIPLFLGVTMEEAEQYYDEESREYKKELSNLSVGYSNGFGSCSFYDSTECANVQYNLAITDGANHDFLYADEWREKFPLEDLDVCSKEEALEVCRPYAQALGYDDEHAVVYAVTLDKLEKEYNSIYGTKAPDPEVTYENLERLRKEGPADKLAEMELALKWGHNKDIKWTKEDEAFYIVYPQYVDGELVQDPAMSLKIIYAPQYEKPISFRGLLPMEKKEVLMEAELLSREEAVKRIMLDEWVESPEDLEIQSMSLVPSMVQEGDVEGYIKVPFWKIEYCVTNNGRKSQKKVMINAVSQEIVK